jgi:hypothetical protein
MAVQVTGFFQNPQTGLIYQSPLLTLVPHLQYAGANEINSESTFTKYSPPAPEPTPEPEVPVVEEIPTEEVVEETPVVEETLGEEPIV